MANTTTGVLAALAATSNVIDSGVNAPTTVLGETPFTEEERAAAKARITAAAQATLDDMENGVQNPTLPIIQPYMGPVDEAEVAAAKAAAQARITPAAAATILSEEEAAKGGAAKKTKKAAKGGKAKRAIFTGSAEGVLESIAATHNVIDSGVYAPTTVLGTAPFSEEDRAAAKERITAAAQKTLDAMESGYQYPVLPIIQPYMGPVDEAEVAAAKAAAEARITPAAAATLMTEEEAAAISAGLYEEEYEEEFEFAEEAELTPEEIAARKAAAAADVKAAEERQAAAKLDAKAQAEADRKAAAEKVAETKAAAEKAAAEALAAEVKNMLG